MPRFAKEIVGSTPTPATRGVQCLLSIMDLPLTAFLIFSVRGIMGRHGFL